MKAGLPPATSDFIAADGRQTQITITIPKGIEITGRVVGKDEKPIPGVRVDPVVGTAGPLDIEAQMAPVQEPWTTTDQEGRFTGRLTSSTNGLSFAKKGYVRAEQAVSVQGGMKPVEVTLVQGGSIAGKVVNKDGSPAAEVVVSAGERVVMSGPDGSFLIEGVEPGPQVIRFGRMGLQQRTVNAPVRDLTLTLPATRSIQGRVVDAVTGAPVEKFTISPSLGDEFSIPTPFESASGEFKVDVPEGRAKLSVEAAGYVTNRDFSIDPASNAAITIKLARGRTLRGKVVDEKQQPIAGVMIAVGHAMPSFDESGGPQTRPDGSFELTGIGFDDDARLVFQKDGYVKAERKVKAGQDDATLDVVLRRGISLTGRVVDRSGAGIAGVRIDASSSALGAQSETVESDSSGAFRFATLAPARYDFAASRNEAGEHGAAKDVDVEKIHELTIRLEKIPTATIFGHVTGLDGSSIQRFVSIRPVEGEFVMAPIDAAGNFRTENAPAGTLEVMGEVYGSRGQRTTKKVTVDVAAGSEARVDLAFPAQVTIHGHALRGVVPITNASIRFSGSVYATAVTGAEGTYESALEPGEYDVSMAASDGKAIPFAQRITVVDPAEFDFRVDPTTLTATVLDAETGQPIGDAAVTASHRGETHSLTSARTNADGSASLEISRGELMTVMASKSGYANASEDVAPGENRSVILRLARTPGAVVRIVDVRSGSTLTGYVIARDVSGRVVASANEADPDGTVTLPLAPGPYLISASAEGFGSHTVKGEVPSGEIRVPLPRGGNLTIRSNSDVHGTARLIQPDGEEYVRCWCSGIAEIKIDSRMTLVDRIAPGAYTLEVILAGGKPRRFPVSIVEGQNAIVAMD